MAIDGPAAAEHDADDQAAPPLTRMAIAVLAVLGLLVAGYLSAYKLGFIGGLTCTVGHCEQVQASPWSVLLGLPVSVWGFGAYAALLALSILGLQPRFVHDRRIALAITGVSLVGVAFSGYLTYIEAFVIEMWCQYCVISAIIITLVFLLSLPGLARAR